MSKVIGIICEGPADQLVIKAVVDHITGEENDYRYLQPEPDCQGLFGNGWKGVWKWCEDNADQLNSIMEGITPKMDAVIIHMDGDVSRKEKEAHCFCTSVECSEKNKVSPLRCEAVKRNLCPVNLPCNNHSEDAKGRKEHLQSLISRLLKNQADGKCIIMIPCDSTETWIVSAYGDSAAPEEIEDPWKTVISKKTHYHDIRVKKKSLITYRNFIPQLVKNWSVVTEQCITANAFETDVKEFLCK